MSQTPYKPAGADLPMMVHVTAPAALPAGYRFDADINGDPSKRFTCEIPEGGVEEGQVFLAPLTGYDGPRLDAPTGDWKDGLCDWYKPGLFHSSLCCSLWCTQIAMAQVMSRMQLTWLGGVGPANKTRQTFMVILLLVIAFFVYSVALEIAAFPYAALDEPIYIPILRIGGDLLFSLWAFIALCRTRQTVRQRYQIPEHQCKGCEDACCSLWCGCCVAAQMMRHTGEYETYAGVCCSASGHPPGAPLVV